MKKENFHTELRKDAIAHIFSTLSRVQYAISFELGFIFRTIIMSLAFICRRLNDEVVSFRYTHEEFIQLSVEKCKNVTLSIRS